jgi:hypothetical protein
MTIELFFLIGGILNFIAFIVSLLLIDDIRVFAFLIFLFIPYTYAIGVVSMGIVCLVEKIRELL